MNDAPNAPRSVEISWTETRRFESVPVQLDRLVALLMEHVPQHLSDSIAEMMADKGRTEIDDFAPVFRALHDDAARAGIEAEANDFEDIEVTEA